jgi:hypothetical protein
MIPSIYIYIIHIYIYLYYIYISILYVIPPIYINIDMHEPSNLLGSSSCLRRNEANIMCHFTSARRWTRRKVTTL